MHSYDYDLFVIGCGSAGVRLSRISASHGAKVAVCEPQKSHGAPNYSALGGTCVNVGCVPKKLMVLGSHFPHEMQTALGYGWSSAELKLDWNVLVSNKNREIDRLNGIYENMLISSGVEVLLGWGRLVDSHTVEFQPTDGGAARRYTAAKIAVCVGGWPFMPELPGAGKSPLPGVITSNEAFYLPSLPKKVVIVGGGYIAVEFAGIFNGYGSDVTLLYRKGLFLGGGYFDDDMRVHLCNEMRKAGVKLRFNATPTAIEENVSDGGLQVHVHQGETDEAGAGPEVCACDVVLFATGRTSRTQGLGLEEVGVQLREDGAIVVDEWSETSVEGIFALGDVTDRMQLTPVALHEAHCLADTLFGDNPRKPDHSDVPSAVFSQPPLAQVGLTQAQAETEWGENQVQVFRSIFTPLHRTMFRPLPEQQKVLMKLVVHTDTDRVVGAHMVGDGAAEILQGLAIAVKAGCTKRDFDRTIGIHPSAAEEFVTMRTPVARGRL